MDNSKYSRLIMEEEYLADAICITCGSTKEHHITGFCMNDHDNWLEIDDAIEAFQDASERLGVSVEEIIHAIKHNIDIKNC